MRHAIVLICFLAACTTTRIIERPAPPLPMKVPTAPKTEKPAEKSPEVKPVEASNHAADLIGFVKPFQESGYRCLPWTGEGTKYPGLDAYVCQGPTQIVWCAAPLMGKPICDTVLDWTDPKTKKPAAKATAPQK